MTFAEKLSHVAKDDPKFARSVKRIRIASWVFGIAVAAALGFAGWSLWIGFSNQSQITKIESPCLKYGAKSEQCKQAFEQAVLTITHAEACAILRKSGLDIPPCAHARLRQEHRRGRERAATAERSRRADVSQPGSTGHQQQSPSSDGVTGVGGGAGNGGSHGGSAPGKGGSGQVTEPAPSGSTPASASPSSGSSAGQSHEPEAPPASAPAHPVVEGAGKAAEDVGGVVAESGKTANEAVGGIGGTAEGAVCGALAPVGCSK